MRNELNDLALEAIAAGMSKGGGGGPPAPPPEQVVRNKYGVVTGTVVGNQRFDRYGRPAGSIGTVGG